MRHVPEWEREHREAVRELNREVTGYAVAIPGDTAQEGGPVWYGGGKRAPDLTWPKLRQRWSAPGTTPGDRFIAAERNAIWEHAAHAAEDAAARCSRSLKMTM